MKTTTCVATTACGLALLGTAQTTPAALLFADNFDRPDSTDLNASTAGKSGSLGALDWTEAGFGGFDIISGEANQANTNNAKAWVDHNFIGLTELTESLEVDSIVSSGNARYHGFSIGQSLAELQAQTETLNDHGPGDVFIGLDDTGGTRGVAIFHNGVLQQQPGNVSDPDTISATFTFADMNAGTTINYEVFLNGISLTTGSTTWSGTNENYIAIQGNANNNSQLDNFSVEGVPEPGALALLAGGGLCVLRRRCG